LNDHLWVRESAAMQTSALLFTGMTGFDIIGTAA
jgi:hypothetical protein